MQNIKKRFKSSKLYKWYNKWILGKEVQKRETVWSPDRRRVWDKYIYYPSIFEICKDKLKTKFKKYLTIRQKGYRLDLELWEEKVPLLLFFHYWKYDAYGNFSVKTLKRKSYDTVDVMYKAYVLPDIQITKKELEERYNGNKWLIGHPYKYTDNENSKI